VVAEILADLAQDGRDCETGERHAVVGLEPVGGLDQGECRGLDEIIDRFAAAWRTGGLGDERALTTPR
jgi:hypothetical protein